MKIKKIETIKTDIPLKFKYSHAKASHNCVHSVICIIHDDNGNTGYGEAVPRLYVTGETCESVILAIRQISKSFMNMELTPDILKEKMTGISNDFQGPFPSCALCAFEGALLDLMSREKGVSLAALFGGKEAPALTYTGSIGISSKKMILAKSFFYKMLGFKKFKIKTGKELDVEGIKFILKTLGRNCTFYVDANCSWEKEAAIKNVEILNKLGIWAIEEPLIHSPTEQYIHKQLNREAVLNDKHYENYRWLKERSPLPIIADESLISPGSFRKIMQTGSFDILNMRLSKCGGFILSSNMIEEAGLKNMSYGIGAMVAESPILANEGAHFGIIHNQFKYIQGFSHFALHKKQIASGGPNFKKNATINIDMNKVSLGLTINEKQLNKYTAAKEIWET